VNNALTSPSTGENPWKLALEGSGVGVWDWDLCTGAQSHSVGWEEMLGYSAGEIDQKYQAFATRVHPDDLELVLAAAKSYLEGQSSEYAADFRMRCKDGSWKWILTRGMVVKRDAQGNALRMIGTHTDISERKQAEADLRTLNAQLLENTQWLQTTLTSISQGIIVFDPDTRVRKFNPQVCDLLNIPNSFLATRPTLRELNALQLAKNDFGPGANRVEELARNYVLTGGEGVVPLRYLRETQFGRTLEIRTQILPSGGMVRTFSDVTDYVQAEAARKRLDVLLAATQSIARVGGWERDFVSGTAFWTEGIYRLLEVSPQEFTPSDLNSTQQFFTPQALERIRAVPPEDANANAITSHDMELEMVTAKGRPIWVRFKGTTAWEQGHPLKRTSVLQDITEQKRSEAAIRENEDRWKLALESTGDGVWDWYIQTGEEFFSKRLIESYGYSEDEIKNHPGELDKRTHPDDAAQMEHDRQAHFAGLTPTYMNEHRVRCKDDSWKWVLSRGMVISRDAQGKPLRMIGTHTDITSRKNSEAMIRQQAFYDALTGLPNRRMLRDRLEQEIKKTRRDDQQLAILFIDLDHFKEVNDTLGHDSGDLLLVEAARRIQACVRESDTVARMGGDEFTVILSELPNTSHLEGVLQKLLQAMGEVFQLGAEQVFVSASIGITMYPSDATDIESLYKNADQALYVAKGAGRNRFSFFTPALQEAAQTRVRLANDLRTALVEQQFRVVYQPIVNLTTGAIHKAEALIRWQHPTRGLVSPAAFIPIAEASGLIVDIGEWVFQQAMAQVQRWRQTLDPRFQISVNKSPVQFHHNDTGRAPWDLQLQAQGLPGACIVVEITEGLLLDTSTSVADQLLELRDSGIQVSLDDFGTGYSSLSYLQKFDIDFVKIDQSFVRHLIDHSTDLALCKAIIVMAHALGMKVIAEGVETQLQRDLLATAGCDYAQGYFYARPMSEPDFDAFVADYTKRTPV
jgi:diguanylate cyclase (GGDEF)-like protein/PAS domain S-box-containing protein